MKNLLAAVAIAGITAVAVWLMWEPIGRAIAGVFGRIAGAL